MSTLLVLPIIIPLFTAAIMLIFRHSLRVQHLLGVGGTSTLLITALLLLIRAKTEGILVTQVGNWPAPFGITLIVDVFSAIMVVLTGLMGLSISIYSLGFDDPQRDLHGYYPLLHMLLMGVNGAFLTGDIFNLYVWFEVMLIASFVLMALGGTREQIIGAIKYVTLNLMASGLFLAAVGLLYGTVGTLNMADLAVKLPESDQPHLITALALLFLIAFGIKAAMFPLFFWLPASYHTPPVPVSALFAGLLTKVGVYALIRIFTLLFVQDIQFTHNLILILAGFTMVVGVLGAVAQIEFRRLLSFHIISQIGYLLMGLGLFSIASIAGAVFFMAHVILAKSTLFLISGISHRIHGTYHLKKLGGLYRSYPALAFLFLIPALSLAGVPPLSGFFAKLALVKAGLGIGQYAIVSAALGVSILTLFSMMKIWTEAFLKPHPLQKTNPHNNPASTHHRRGNPYMYWPVIALSVLILAMGLAAEPLYNLATMAAEQLMDPSGYISAVLGG